MKRSCALALLLLLPIALGAWWFFAPYEGAFGWMPRQINSAYGNDVDQLYVWIMYLVAIMFFLTEGLLVWYIFRYRAKDGGKAHYSHGSNKAELTWTIIPGILLLVLALTQAGTWNDIKSGFPDPKSPDTALVQVFAQQFNWNFRYAGPDGRFGTDDDYAVEGPLTVPAGKKVLLHMTSKDVTHSLFLPYLRVKQDAVPGMMTRAWFQTDHIPVWNLKAQRAGAPTGETGKNFLEFIPLADFDRLTVASNFDNAFTFRSEVISDSGVRKYWYDVDPEREVTIWNGGASRREKAAAADYVLFPLDVACAELCGNQHYSMAGSLHILPPAPYEEWKKSVAKPAVSDLWKKIWDTHFPHYN